MLLRASFWGWRVLCSPGNQLPRRVMIRRLRWGSSVVTECSFRYSEAAQVVSHVSSCAPNVGLSSQSLRGCKAHPSTIFLRQRPPGLDWQTGLDLNFTIPSRSFGLLR